VDHQVRIGYSFWGFLGNGITDTPDGGRSSRRRPSVDALAARRHDIVFLQVRVSRQFPLQVTHDEVSSLWVRSGVRSPSCCAIVHPLRFGISLTSADTFWQQQPPSIL
jgi:hypothetical protein